MSDPYSPYRYIDLSEQTWDSRSEELIREEESRNSPRPEQEAARRLFKEIVTALFAYPRELLSLESTSPPKEVCVIGGGVAGLTAAYELISRGHKVTLLEASMEFGGRLRTHRFGDGTYGELGAMRIPFLHGCVNHYVDKFHLGTRPFVGSQATASLYLRGKKFKLGDIQHPQPLSALLNLYQLQSPIDEVLSTKGPFEGEKKLNELLGAAIDREALELMFKHFEIPPYLEVYEQTTMGQLMMGKPLALGGVGLSNEGFELFGRATGILWFENVSYLQWIINELALYEPNKYELDGGMRMLTDTLVSEIARITHPQSVAALLMTSAQVKELRLREGKVEVDWLAGIKLESRSFDYVICTAPAPAAARMRFDPPLPSRQYEALTNLTYASAAKTIVHCTERFWESVDNIYGGGSFSDLPHQQCWYPSDNSEAAHNARLQMGLIQEGSQAIDWKAASTEKSKQPGVFTAAYMWGPNARRFAAIGNAERTDLVLSSVERVHPNVRSYIGDMNKDIIHCAWDNESSPGSGAFVFFAPGEQRRYQASLCQPHLYDRSGQPHLFFAGEHLAIAHAWIQSAIQTALSAVMHILNAP
jgi:monoamine oxidase